MGLCNCYKMLCFRVFDLGRPVLEIKKQHALSQASCTGQCWLYGMNDTLASRMSSSSKDCMRGFYLSYAKANIELRADGTMG